MHTVVDIVVCVSNEGYLASLEPRKLYAVLADARAREQGLLRIVDESGEDYLYPEALFAAVDLSETTRRALHLAA